VNSIGEIFSIDKDSSLSYQLSSEVDVLVSEVLMELSDGLAAVVVIDSGALEVNIGV
jgi:citrate lyase gamma subunit